MEALGEVHSLIDEVREQVERLSDFVAEQDAQLLVALEELRQLTGGAHTDPASPRAIPIAPSAKRTFDRQEYRDLVGRLREMAATATPAGVTVAVVNKGDPQLLQLQGRRGWHFPQMEDGTFAGFYPADGTAAIEALERIRTRGADYLLLPATAFWWLEHYKGFAEHLVDRYATVARDDQTGILFALREGLVSAPPVHSPKQQEYRWMTKQLREVVRSVLPVKARLLVVSKGDPELLDLAERDTAHFLQDANGDYAGHHPADSSQATVQLEKLRQGGAEFLVIPKTMDWWLEHYRDFALHLRANYRMVVHQRYVCKIFDLKGR